MKQLVSVAVLACISLGVSATSAAADPTKRARANPPAYVARIATEAARGCAVLGFQGSELRRVVTAGGHRMRVAAGIGMNSDDVLVGVVGSSKTRPLRVFWFKDWPTLPNDSIPFRGMDPPSKNGNDYFLRSRRR